MWLSGLFAIVALPVGVINLFLPRPIPVPLDLVAGYLLGTMATFIGYVYGRLENIRDRQERLLRQPARGIEVFTTSEEFLEKLVNITVGATTVSTLNLSPPKGEHPGLDKYFTEVHNSIKSRRSPLKSFRSIASVDTIQKSLWLAERSCELLATGRVSFAVFDQDYIGPLPHPLSLHITHKEGRVNVFIFPPVDLTGSMDSVLISDPVLAKIMLDYFNMRFTKQFGVNLYLEAPENGGELHVWDLTFDGVRSRNIPSTSRTYGFDAESLPSPDITIKPCVGDLVIIRSTRLHAVKETTRGRRVSISGFLGRERTSDILRLWS